MILTVVFLGLAALGVVGAHFNWLSSIFGLCLVLVVMGILFVRAIPAILYLIFNRKELRWRHGVHLLLGLVGAGAVGLVVYVSIQHPVTDLQLDPNESLLFRRVISRVPNADVAHGLGTEHTFTAQYDLSQSAKQIEKYPELSLVRSKAGEEDLRAAIFSAVQKSFPEWTLTYQDPKEIHFEYETVRQPFRFVDDVIVAAKTNKFGDEFTINARYRARYGWTDFGMGAKRLLELQLSLSSAVKGLKEKPKAPPPVELVPASVPVAPQATQQIQLPPPTAVTKPAGAQKKQ